MLAVNRCLRVIKGYEHYREGTCVLFDDAEIARWNQQWDANMIRQEALVAQQQFWPADEVRSLAIAHPGSLVSLFSAHLPAPPAVLLLMNQRACRQVAGTQRQVHRHHCPTCGAANVKMLNNNHIACEYMYDGVCCRCALCRVSQSHLHLC